MGRTAPPARIAPREAEAAPQASAPRKASSNSSMVSRKIAAPPMMSSQLSPAIPAASGPIGARADCCPRAGGERQRREGGGPHQARARRSAMPSPATQRAAKTSPPGTHISRPPSC